MESKELEQGLVSTSVYNGKTKVYQATIDMDGQNGNEGIVIARAKKGEKFVVGFVHSDADTSAVFRIGTWGDDDMFRGYGKTTGVETGTPTVFGNIDAMKALDNDEDIVLKTTGSFADNGTLKISMIFAVNN